MTDFMSKAHALRNAVNWNSNESVEVIAAALREARAEGLEEAAKAADEYAAEMEEAAPFEDSPDYTERMLVYAKHVRRAAYQIRELKEAQS